MEEKLARLMNSLTPAEADEFIDSFDTFGESEVSPKAQSRILSSVMRKAGAEMKETKNIKPSKRHTKRIIGFVVVAALCSAALAVGASAAVKHFISHKDNALHAYMDNSALIEELDKRAGEPIVCENEHLRLTVDTVMSDDIYIHCTATLEGLDDEGKGFIADRLILDEEVAEMTDSEIAEYFEKPSDRDAIIPYMLAYSQQGERSDLKIGFTDGDDLYYPKLVDYISFCGKRYYPEETVKAELVAD